MIFTLVFYALDAAGIRSETVCLFLCGNEKTALMNIAKKVLGLLIVAAGIYLIAAELLT